MITQRGSSDCFLSNAMKGLTLEYIDEMTVAQ